MNRNYTELKFPDVKGREWATVLTGNHIPASGIDFVSKVLRYEPKTRLTPLGACLHPFFDRLRQDPSKMPVLLPTRKPLPDHLFTFTDEEIDANAAVVCQLVPQHARNAQTWTAKLKIAWQSVGKAMSESDARAPVTAAASSAAAGAAAAAAGAASATAAVTDDFPGTDDSESEDAPNKGKDTSADHA